VGPRIGLDGVTRRISSHCQESNPQFFDRPAHSLVTLHNGGISICWFTGTGSSRQTDNLKLSARANVTRLLVGVVGFNGHSYMTSPTLTPSLRLILYLSLIGPSGTENGQ
jgi:hypothetical protein